MSIRITELDAITSLQSGDYIAVDNESTGTHKFDALNIGANIRQNIANTYSSSASYAIGQYCLYDNNLYKCITTISTPEAWNSSHWIQVTVGEGLYEKVDKISGKGLSTNDFTDEYKQKLGGIEAGAEVNVQANWAETNISSDDYIKNKPGNATTETSGFMSASDKQKLDNIASGAEVNVQANWAETDSSKDDYIKNKPTIDDALSTSSTNAVENSAIATAINNEATTRENADNALDGRIDTIEEILPNKANINGSYEEMTVGSAEQLISTESMEDSELYIFRKSGNGADIGDRETDMLVGGTVAWNQLAHDMSTWEGENSRTAVQFSNGVVSATLASGTQGVSAPAVREVANDRSVAVINHKYLLMFDCKSEKGTSVYIRSNSIGNFSLPITSTWSNISVIKNASSASEVYFYIGLLSVDSSFDIGDGFSIKDFNLFDLTAMFGTEIADYIYGLEQANAGDGVAWFRKYFPKPYYTYDAGSLQSVNVASHNMTGFNQWDEEWELGYFNNGVFVPSSNHYVCSKNLIDVVPNVAYYFNISKPYYVLYFDADGNYLGNDNNRYAPAIVTIRSDARYVMFQLDNTYGTTYKNDICINISDANRNGEYEEYVIHSYPYDETVQLRGVPQLVDGELKYDGDTYESSGKVTRKYGIVDLGTLTWVVHGTNDNTFRANISDRASGATNLVCSKYVATDESIGLMSDKTVRGLGSGTNVYIRDTSYSDAAAFKTAMNGVYLVYELATSTEESATGFTNPQIVDAFGTEEYVDAGVKNNTRDVAIPVGHITQYVVNLRDKLQHLPFLAKEDGDYFVNQTGTQMSLKKVEGYYEDLVVGVADNLSTDIRTNDQTPYLFRTSGGSVDIGDREYINSVVGGTIAWNQYVSTLPTVESSFTDGVKVSAVDTTNGKVTVVVDTDGATDTRQFILPLRFSSLNANHKYLQKGCPRGGSLSSYFIGISSRGSYGQDIGNGGILANYGSGFNYRIQITQGCPAGTYVFTPQFFDLTQMFGSTIADYIYSLEQANAGAGVSYFRKLFPKPYYEYNAGELLSVSGLHSHDMVGFNLFDKSKATLGKYMSESGVETSNPNMAHSDYIRVVPNTTYYAKFNGLNGYYGAILYDENKVRIKNKLASNGNSTFVTNDDNCYYVVLNFTKDQIDNVCFNLSWDGSRDGEYEPYQKWSYPLDSSLELRGVPKLDSNNNLYYDGDTYESDGTVTRRYGVVDLGSRSWTYKTTSTNPYFAASLPKDFKTVNANAGNPNVFISNGYLRTNGTSIANNANTNKAFVCGSWEDGANTRIIRIADHSYTDVTAFTTAMSGVYLVYELATPTTESATPYTNPQIVDDFGTEEYVIDSTINVPIPVGHDTDYPINLKSKLEMAPDSPDGDGDYIVRQTNGTNEYVPLIIEDQLPAVPSTDGTYTLTVTIADGKATYSWT